MSAKMDLKTHRMPVFCTAALSVELLEDFTRTTQEKENLSYDPWLPTIMTTTDFDEMLIPRPEPAETWIKPFLEKGSPFLGWTPIEVREFYTTNVKTYQDFDAWPLGTFGILDSFSVLDAKAPTHRTILICSALPDFNEKASVWLKTCRVKFEAFEQHASVLEILTARPSEIGKETYMRFMPPLAFVGRDEARNRISFDLDDDAPYSDEHMAMQGGSEGCVRYFVRALIPVPVGSEIHYDSEEEETKS